MKFPTIRTLLESLEDAASKVPRELHAAIQAISDARIFAFNDKLYWLDRDVRAKLGYDPRTETAHIVRAVKKPDERFKLFDSGDYIEYSYDVGLHQWFFWDIDYYSLYRISHGQLLSAAKSAESIVDFFKKSAAAAEKLKAPDPFSDFEDLLSDQMIQYSTNKGKEFFKLPGIPGQDIARVATELGIQLSELVDIILIGDNAPRGLIVPAHEGGKMRALLAYIKSEDLWILWGTQRGIRENYMWVLTPAEMWEAWTEIEDLDNFIKTLEDTADNRVDTHVSSNENDA